VAASGWRGIAVFTTLAVVFYAPYGLITAELGSAWPQEGGMYVWIREAYGERVGGVCAWFYWVNLAYWAPAVFVIFAGTVRTAFWPSMSRTWEELIVIGLLWLVVAVGILPLRLTTWVNNASAAAKMAVLIAAAVVGLVYAAQHGIANPINATQLWPGTGIGLAAVAVILSNFCGWEVMSSLGGSIKDPRRDIPRMILIAGIAIVGTQILGMTGILAALPLRDLSIVSGIADAMDLSFRLVLGSGAAASAAYDVVIVLLLFSFVGTMITWSTGANHSINVTGLDRSAPRVFGHLNRRFGTPDYAFVLMAALATVLTVLNYALFGGNEQIFWTVHADVPGPAGAAPPLPRRRATVPGARRTHRRVARRDPCRDVRDPRPGPLPHGDPDGAVARDVHGDRRGRRRADAARGHLAVATARAGGSGDRRDGRRRSLTSGATAAGS
jgi:amino acid transporter